VCNIGSVYDLFLYSLPVLEAPHPGRQPKLGSNKKIKLLYSLVKGLYSSVSRRL
jgi:hypothetical protein